MGNFSVPESPKVRDHWASAHFWENGKMLVKELRGQCRMETAYWAAQPKGSHHFSHCQAGRGKLKTEAKAACHFAASDGAR